MKRRDFLKATAILSLGSPFAHAQSTNTADATPARVTLFPGHPEEEEYSFKEFTDHKGNVLKADEIAGKHLLVYGGYFECTGVCPAAAGSLVGAMKTLAKEDPLLREQIVPIVVMIKNNPDRGTPQERAETWQNEGLDHKNTGIRVLVSEDEAVLKDFMRAFEMDIRSNESGALIHSPHAYLFNKDGEMMSTADREGRILYVNTLINTQKGAEHMIKALRARVPFEHKAQPYAPMLSN